MNWPRRRWVVESRTAMFPNAPWHIRMGPFFRERTARDMMRRARWFDGGLVAWRVTDNLVAVARVSAISADRAAKPAVTSKDAA